MLASLFLLGALLFFVNSTFYGTKIKNREEKISNLENKNQVLNKRIASLETKIIETNTKLDKALSGKNSPITHEKIFAPDSQRVYYQLDDTERTVSVYLTEEGRAYRIIRDVPVGLANPSMPEFLLTSDPNVVLLTTEDADMGWRYKNYYYIDIQNDWVVTVLSNNQGYMKIINREKTEVEIATAIENSCYEEQTMGCKNSGNAYIKDLMLNGEKINLLKKPKTLSCYNPEGLGNCYKENFQIEYRGISKDMKKIFFTFSGMTEEKGGLIDLWRENYSFDLMDRKTKQEEPNNLLQ